MFFSVVSYVDRRASGWGRGGDLVYQVNRFLKITLKRMDSQDKCNRVRDKIS